MEEKRVIISGIKCLPEINMSASNWRKVCRRNVCLGAVATIIGLGMVGCWFIKPLPVKLLCAVWCAFIVYHLADMARAGEHLG